MSQCLVTIVAPLEPTQLEAAQAAIDKLDNPANPAVAAALDRLDENGSGTHFASLHALPSFTAGRAHLILEFSGDGTEAEGIARIVAAIGPELATIFALAPDWHDGDVSGYLTRHSVRSGYGLRDNPGIGHAGAPGMTVGRIRDEEALACKVAALLADQPGGWCALDRLNLVRAALGPGAAALTPGDAAPAFIPSSIPTIVATALLGLVRTFLWPLLLALAIWVIGIATWRASAVAGTRERFYTFLDGAGWAVTTGALAFLVLLAGLYAHLRRCEATDWISDRAPDRAVLRDILRRENAGAQNHMVSLTELKAGPLRRLTIRLALWAVAALGPKLYKPGYLGPVGTIHFARWITLPGTRDFVFFSNYGGSWEAYLEDFITLAHLGLTGVWSNTLGFPRASNLFQGGATDGERFKRYARQSMLPTRFWYSAYPELNTDMIRANAGVRRGLSGALTEDDAATWLAHFGSAIRPDDRMETSKIQSLVFGGLGFLAYSGLTTWQLPPDRGAARRWLAAVAPYIAYDDGRRVRDDDRVNAIIQLGLSASGLAALDLPPDALDSFPPAFLDDMQHPGRARILGDTGEDAPDCWWWGQTSRHVAVIIYGQTAEAFAAMTAELDAIAAAHGATGAHKVELKTFDRADNLEPFGFADGGSQPVILGTYKGLKSGDPLHLVEPGEFVLGYPDNRGNRPPGPVLDPLHDPRNQLPVLDAGSDFASASVNKPRELGRNGTFLVIRQLEQDPEVFQAYCEAEAVRLAKRLSAPFLVTADFIAAKLVGRWRNGSPIVRAGYTESQSAAVIADNSFQLGAEDPEGLRCPFGAHIRRANPRDSLNPESVEQIAISNRHRILRIGRKYVPRDGQKPGLLFMCLNGDIERQFEFVQQTWLHGNVISLSCPISLKGEGDPILGAGRGSGFTIPSRDGPVHLAPPPRVVTMRGGGYFFLPSRCLITYLSETADERLETIPTEIRRM